MLGNVGNMWGGGGRRRGEGGNMASRLDNNDSTLLWKAGGSTKRWGLHEGSPGFHVAKYTYAM